MPCFWIYYHVGCFILKESGPNNKYVRWIENYSSKDFAHSVQEFIHIFDTLSVNANNEIKEKMLNAFYTSTCLEWHFWNDAYRKNSFDDIF